MLNPFRVYIDINTYISGNANLKPQYTNNLNLTHNFNNLLISTLFYQHISDFIIQTPQQNDETGESGVIQDNFGHLEMTGLNISLPNLILAKWWILSVNAWSAWTHLHTKQNQIIYDEYGLNMSTYITNTFTLTETWKTEINTEITTPSKWGFFKIKTQFQSSIGVKKSFYDNKLNITINLEDPFNLNKDVLDVKYDKYDYQYTTRWSSRRLRFGITWRFGSTKSNNTIRERKRGNEDELSRMKTN